MKINKVLLITASILLVFGAVISVTAMKLMSVTAMNSAERITKEITEKVSNIDISSDIGNINILTADTDKITLDYFTSDNRKYEMKTENNTLSLKYLPYNRSSLKWYDYFINLDFHPKQYYDITLTIPKTFSANIALDAKYGDINISNVNGNINAVNSCGDIKIVNGNFSALDCRIDFGDIEIEQITADHINLSGDCGDIEFDRINSSHITLENNCGDIEGTISGSESEYKINGHTRFGDNNISNRTDGEKVLDIKNDFGDIDIQFIP